MSQRNDETFAKFMLQLAQKMVDRDDHNLAATEEARNNLFAAVHVWLTPPSAPITLPVVKTFPPTLAYGPFKDVVTNGELELIRAYFRGEDVVTTLLAQER